MRVVLTGESTREVMMVWVILAALGIPLWLCAVGAFMLILSNRRLRKRPGDIPVRVRRRGEKRWARGHAVWVSNVFAVRSGPAGWSEDLAEVTHASARVAAPAERKQLHRLAEDPVILSLTLVGGATLDVAASPAYRTALWGPFGAAPANGRAAAVGSDERSSGSTP